MFTATIVYFYPFYPFTATNDVIDLATGEEINSFVLTGTKSRSKGVNTVVPLTGSGDVLINEISKIRSSLDTIERVIKTRK